MLSGAFFLAVVATTAYAYGYAKPASVAMGMCAVVLLYLYCIRNRIALAAQTLAISCKVLLWNAIDLILAVCVMLTVQMCWCMVRVCRWCHPPTSADIRSPPPTPPLPPPSPAGAAAGGDADAPPPPVVPLARHISVHPSTPPTSKTPPPPSSNSSSVRSTPRDRDGASSTDGTTGGSDGASPGVGLGLGLGGASAVGLGDEKWSRVLGVLHAQYQWRKQHGESVSQLVKLYKPFTV